MSVAATNSRGHDKSQRRAIDERTGVKLLFVSVSVVSVGGLAAALGTNWEGIARHWATWLVWVGVVAVADLLPVRLWGSVTLSMSLPITLAAGMALSPPEAGLIAFLGSIDPREFRREISIWRGVFNRSQVAISAASASWVFHLGGVPPLDWPQVLPSAIGALAVDFTVNAVLVCAAMALETSVKPHDVLREMFAPDPLEFGATYLCLGLQAPLVAVAESVGGSVALVMYLGPLALARHSFVQAQSLHQFGRKVEAKNKALVHVSAHVMGERRDERMSIAGELHDSVLPPLFRVHLLGQVLRQDLASGRLLNLDDDLPALLDATEAAQDALRDVIRGLQRSVLGARGLDDTVKLLALQLQAAGGPPVRVDCKAAAEASSLAQLLAYQVIREALDNAAKHAKANSIRVRVWHDQGDIRVVVDDDGLGFDRQSVDRESHFGLQLMEERIEAAGGRVYVDSELGLGTRVVATIPAGADQP